MSFNKADVKAAGVLREEITLQLKGKGDKVKKDLIWSMTKTKKQHQAVGKRVGESEDVVKLLPVFLSFSSSQKNTWICSFYLREEGADLQ